MYGRLPPLICYGQMITPNSDLETQLLAHDQALLDLEDHLAHVQSNMKQADLHGKELEFVVRDLVYLKIRPYRL